MVCRPKQSPHLTEAVGALVCELSEDHGNFTRWVGRKDCESLGTFLMRKGPSHPIEKHNKQTASVN